MGVPISRLGYSPDPSFIDRVADEDGFVNMYELLDGDTPLEPDPDNRRVRVLQLDGFTAVGTRIIDVAMNLAVDSVRPEDTDRPTGRQAFFQNGTLIVKEWEYGASDGKLAERTDTIDDWANRYGQDQQPPLEPQEVQALVVLSRAMVKVRDLDE